MRKLTVIMLALLMVLSSATMAMAAPFDLIKADGSETHSFTDFIDSPSIFDEVAYNMTEYLIEDSNGQLFRVSEVQDSLDAGAETLADAVVDLTPVEINEELTVESVSAITDQMLPANDAEAELKFLVNGKEELTATEFDEKYGEEDYTVAYKYNFNEELDAKPAGTYKYAVEVTDAEGNKLPEGGVVAADFVDFKLVDATKAVKVNTLGLFADGEAWENATVMTEDNVSIKAAIYENELGQKNTDKDEDGNTVVDINEPIIKEIKSSDPLTAYYDEAKIVVRKDGEVTFTVVFEDAKLEVLQKTVKVTTKAEQKATTIEAKDLKVQENAVVPFDIKYFDQDGEEVRGVVSAFYTATLAGKTEAETATALAPHTFTEEGNYVVKVYAEANKKTELGLFNVKVVSVDGNPDAYELEIPKSDGKAVELILNVDEDAEGYNDTMDLIVKAFIEEVAVELPAEGVVYEVKSSNEDVLTVGELDRAEGTITVTAVKEGTATVTLYTVEGALKEEVASIELEVKNTTAKINNLTLAKDVKTLDVIKSEDGTWDVYNPAQLVSSDLKENETIEGKIEKVEFSENDGKAIVTIKDIYGGKEFVFDAIEVLVAKFDFVTLNKESGWEGKAIYYFDGDFEDNIKAEDLTSLKFTGLLDGEEISVTSVEDRKTVHGDRGTAGYFFASQANFEAFKEAQPSHAEVWNATKFTDSNVFNPDKENYLDAIKVEYVLDGTTYTKTIEVTWSGFYS